MWWQILPGFAIVVAGLAVPGYALWGLHYLCLGNHYRRSLLDRWERSQYQRDMRLTGNPYKVNGLESIKPYEMKEEDKKKRVHPDGTPFKQ